MMKKIIITFLLILITPFRVSADEINNFSVEKTISPTSIDQCSISEVTLTLDVPEQQVSIRKKLDIALIMDHSYSMFEYNDGRMHDAQVAAVDFVESLDPTYDNLALLRFSADAETQVGLTSSHNPIKNKINAYYLDSFSSFTNIEKAIDEAIDELTSGSARSDATKVAVLLSDGGVNRPTLNGVENKTHAKAKALEAAQDAKDEGIKVYTIALNGDQNVDKDLLAQIATVTNAETFEVDNLDELINAYNDISTALTSTVASNVTVTELLSSSFSYVANSALPLPTNILSNLDGTTELVWFLGDLVSGETQTIKYSVSPKTPGLSLPVTLSPQSKVSYTEQDEEENSFMYTEELYLNVSAKNCTSPESSAEKDSNVFPEDKRDHSQGTSSQIITFVASTAGSIFGASSEILDSASTFIEDAQSPQVAGVATCTDPWFWWLAFVIQFLLHFLIRLIGTKRRILSLVANIALAVFGLFYFWKNFCPWWDILVSGLISLLFLILSIRTKKVS